MWAVEALSTWAARPGICCRAACLYSIQVWLSGLAWDTSSSRPPPENNTVQLWLCGQQTKAGMQAARALTAWTACMGGCRGLRWCFRAQHPCSCLRTPASASPTLLLLLAAPLENCLGGATWQALLLWCCWRTQLSEMGLGMAALS